MRLKLALLLLLASCASALTQPATTTAPGTLFTYPLTLPGKVQVSGNSFGVTGNVSATAWTTSGIREANVSGTLTDTSSTGTVANAYTSVWGGDTIAANSSVTYTAYYSGYFKSPSPGTNVAFTKNYALGADSLNTTTLSVAGQVETFPASGNIVGLNDTQTLTNKSISGAQINSGTISATVLPTATSSAKGIVQGDGSTLTISSGTISCTAASNTQVGCATSPVGTSGYALIGNGSPAATFQGFLQTGASATTRTWNSKASDWVSLYDFGAVCDGTTDDTTAISNAITAAQNLHGMLVIPDSGTNGCLVSSTLTITAGMSIIGQGWSINNALSVATALFGSWIKVKSTFSTSTDVLSITPATNAEIDGIVLADFGIWGQSSSGRDALRVNTASNGAVGVTEVRHVAFGNTSGWGINLVGNGVDADAYLFSVHHSFLMGLKGGIQCGTCGDSIYVLNNWIHSVGTATSGVGVGVLINQNTNAGNFVVHGNNISAAAAGVQIIKGIKCVISSNEIEQQIANQDTNGAIIDVGTGASIIDSCSIVNNMIQDQGSFPAIPLYIGAATHTFIDGNRLAKAAATDALVLSATAAGTILGVGNYFPNTTSCGGNTGVNCVNNSNGASNPVYVVKTALPTGG